MIFIDTTEWVAEIDTSDALHDDGRAVVEALVEGRSAPALTTDFVLDETMTLLKRRGAKGNKVAETVEQLLSSRLVTIVYLDETIFRESLANFRKYEKMSFTDAVTLAVMKRYGIREIFSHDKDFDLRGVVRKERP